MVLKLPELSKNDNAVMSSKAKLCKLFGFHLYIFYVIQIPLLNF